VWDIADLAPAAEERISPYTEDSDSQSGEEGDYRGDIDFRDAYEIELEVTKGVRPNVGLYQLQAPDKGTLGSSNIRDTCLLPAAGGSSQSLVALYKSGLLVVHDLATGQATQQYLGHLFDVTDICAAPAAWQQASLFATSADSGDVKLWDMRSRLGVPALTLGNPRASALQAVALAAATSSSSGVGSSSSSSSSQLGGGMLCFTGGANESVWCFDLRRGQAQALYELSTGNTAVQELAWHEGSNTLVASCEGLQEDR
jgi:WD40 repeat protein